MLKHNKSMRPLAQFSEGSLLFPGVKAPDYRDLNREHALIVYYQQPADIIILAARHESPVSQAHVFEEISILDSILVIL